MPAIRSVPQATRRGRAHRAAFTLLETALSTVIIGVGVLAVMEAQQAFLQRNAWSTAASTATYLANEIRERTRVFSRHDRFAGGLFFLNEADPNSLTGWGPETGETTATDLNDLDDLDGVVFGSATNLPTGFTVSRRYPGPLNALAEVIPETLYDGATATTVVDGATAAVALRGWTQCVRVEKVSPTDPTAAVARNATVKQGGATLREVDRYPLRVTVTILFQPDPSENPPPVAVVTWVVPP